MGDVEDHLFVYGTLVPGRPNEHVLADVADQWRPATVRGHLLEEGWGAAMGFPALRLDRDGDAVRGQVLTSTVLVQHWDSLDAFEGDGYERVRTQATLEDGQRVTAEVYVRRGR